MVAIAKQSGHLIQVTAPTGGYTSGQLIELVDMVAVVEDTLAASEAGAAHTTGVFTLSKTAGATTGFTQGDSVYMTSSGAINNTASGDQYVGIAWAAAATSATAVDVSINFGNG